MAASDNQQFGRDLLGPVGSRYRALDATIAATRTSRYLVFDPDDPEALYLFSADQPNSVPRIDPEEALGETEYMSLPELLRVLLPEGGLIAIPPPSWPEIPSSATTDEPEDYLKRRIAAKIGPLDELPEEVREKIRQAIDQESAEVREEEEDV